MYSMSPTSVLEVHLEANAYSRNLHQHKVKWQLRQKEKEGEAEGDTRKPVQRKIHTNKPLLSQMQLIAWEARGKSTQENTHSHLFSTANVYMWNSIFKKIVLPVIDHSGKRAGFFFLLPPSFRKGVWFLPGWVRGAAAASLSAAACYVMASLMLRVSIALKPNRQWLSLHRIPRFTGSPLWPPSAPFFLSPIFT